MSKRKRVLLWAGLLVVLAGVGMVGVRWAMPPAPGVSWANYQRIEVGMPLPDVRMMLGGPGFSFTYQVSANLRSEREQWSSKAGSISVSFDNMGQVTEKTWNPGDETFLDRLRRWLGL